MNKKTWVAMLLVCVMIVIAACGGGGNGEGTNNNSQGSNGNGNGNNGGSNDGDEIVLRMAWWGGQERHDRTLEVIELYEDRNPNITIDAEYSGFDGYFDKLTTQFAAGNAPDIIQYGGNLNDFVFRDVVLPLDDYIGNELDISDHDPSMIEAATFNDQFYGVTLGSNAVGVLINKTLFDEAGVALPDDEWTWEDFDNIAAQLTEGLDGTYGTEYFDHNGLGVYIDQIGKMLHEDGVIGFEKDDVQNWFQLWQDMRENGGVVIPEIQAAASATPEQSMIVARQVAMQLVFSNQLGAYTNATQDELVFHIHPYLDGRNGVALRPSQFLAGSANTNHPEEVAKFLDFFVNDPEATAILGNDRGAPVNATVREGLIESANEVDTKIFEYIAWVAETSDSPYVPNFPGYNETEALFKETSESIAFDQVSIEQGTDEYWAEMERILARYSQE